MLEVVSRVEPVRSRCVLFGVWRVWSYDVTLEALRNFMNAAGTGIEQVIGWLALGRSERVGYTNVL
ncbi:hypothetical protein P3T76_001808 [Phytophthora citrophthora]|uniref:Uncharacterized protein n=1 Tax=Phytophthora citrophthora TaxID=4793 RepID=A0AAD9GWF7_9STRA|nr:hypothetical protein P3T76_001808 [Phytophthora citrophthora]